MYAVEGWLADAKNRHRWFDTLNTPNLSGSKLHIPNPAAILVISRGFWAKTTEQVIPLPSEFYDMSIAFDYKINMIWFVCDCQRNCVRKKSTTLWWPHGCAAHRVDRTPETFATLTPERGCVFFSIKERTPVRSHHPDPAYVPPTRGGCGKVPGSAWWGRGPGDAHLCTETPQACAWNHAMCAHRDLLLIHGLSKAKAHETPKPAPCPRKTMTGQRADRNGTWCEAHTRNARSECPASSPIDRVKWSLSNTLDFS